jgi:plastocyanin
VPVLDAHHLRAFEGGDVSATEDQKELERRNFRKCGDATSGPILRGSTIMSRLLAAAGLATFTLAAAACGGNGYGTTSPSAPGNTPPTADAIIINVVRDNGNQSFSPNPATIPAGQTVVWHNIDSITHRVVLNDGRLDTGNLSPGAFSAATTLGAPSPYHCSIHPDMVGSLVN